MSSLELAQQTYNMLGSNYIESRLYILRLLGIDTLEFGLEIKDYYKHAEPILKDIKELKEKGQTLGKIQQYTLKGIVFDVALSGAPFYAYRLECNDFYLYFADKEMLNNPPVRVKFISGFIWSYGYKEAYQRFIDWFRSFLYTAQSKISRVDICCDTDEAIFIESDIKDMVTRAQGKTLNYVDDVNYQGKKFSGFSIGRGKPIMCRIYNKSMEIKRSNKTWFYSIWILNGSNLDNDIWRVEFQLRRQVLKEFNVNTVEDFFKVENKIWAYLTQEWLSFKSNNNDSNVSRRTVKRKWQVIQMANNNYLVSPAIREKIKVGSLQKVLDQSAGLFQSIAAIEDIDNSKDVGRLVSDYLENKLRKNNTSFQSEKEKRQKQFFSVHSEGRPILDK